ncbi:MAG TPA: type II toxin-antitoxin system ParD family antitoxin [Caulobacteraceae bacterium]|nr:type II toxin-antitoxin system ParD family antitoxin [Caulobacteraceae bacterium]
MDVKLTPELEDLVREKVETGLYQDESEVVAEALRLLDRLDQPSGPEIERLRAAIQVGIDDIAAGRFTTIHNEEELRAFFDDL